MNDVITICYSSRSVLINKARILHMEMDDDIVREPEGIYGILDTYRKVLETNKYYHTGVFEVFTGIRTTYINLYNGKWCDESPAHNRLTKKEVMSRLYYVMGQRYGG